MKYAASIFTFLFLLASCGKEEANPNSKGKSNIVLTVPSTMQISQRTTTEMPGSEGRLLVTIGDITNNQVSVGISWDKGEPLVGTRSLREGEALELEIGSTRYRLILKSLTNVIVGEDTADFHIEKIDSATDQSDAGISSKQEIDILIRSLGELNDASFIRNGVDYSVEDAIDHLKRKLASAGGSIKTADDFINMIASKSSRSGENYRIRLQDGTVISTQQWFTERLKEIRKSLNKTSLLTPDPPLIPAAMTATTPTRGRSRAPGQA